MNKCTSKKLGSIRLKIHKLQTNASDLEKKLKEEEVQLKGKISISIIEIENVLDVYRKCYTKYDNEIDLINSYGGPSPDGGEAVRSLEERKKLLKKIITAFDSLIDKALKAYR